MICSLSTTFRITFIPHRTGEYFSGQRPVFKKTCLKFSSAGVTGTLFFVSMFKVALGILILAIFFSVVLVFKEFFFFLATATVTELNLVINIWFIKVVPPPLKIAEIIVKVRFLKLNIPLILSKTCRIIILMTLLNISRYNYI